jgi:hypothetical protein
VGSEKELEEERRGEGREETKPVEQSTEELNWIKTESTPTTTSTAIKKCQKAI